MYPNIIKNTFLICILGFVPIPNALLADEPAESRQLPAVYKMELSELIKIVVTSRKKEEDISKVPVSITTVSARELQMLGAESLSDLGDFIPDFFMLQDSKIIAIRGVTTDNRNIGIEGGIGTYLDGVYISRAALKHQLFEIERIEVIRGPQGMLFGKNTISGAVSIITKKPTEKEQGYVYANVGNNGRKDARFSYSLPLAEGILGKFSFNRLSYDGYMKNDFNGEMLESLESNAARLQLRFQSSGNLNVDFSADYTDVERVGIPFQMGKPPNEEQAGTLAYFIDFLGLTDAQVPQSSYHVNINEDASNDQSSSGLSLSLNYSIGRNLSLTSITARREAAEDSTADDDALPVWVIASPEDDELTLWSQELRIASTNDQRFTWLVGLYLEQQELNSLRFGDGGEPLVSLISDGVQSQTTRLILDSEVKTQSAALFASADFHVNDAITLSAGARQAKERKDLTFTQFGTCYTAAGGPLVGQCIFPQIDIENDFSDHQFLPDVSISYTASLDTFYYAKVGKGYKSG